MMEKQLSESEKQADEHLAGLRARHEWLKAAASHKAVRAARQAALELQRRQMITARDLRYNEAKLLKMRQRRDWTQLEQRVHDDELSELQKAEVRRTTVCKSNQIKSTRFYLSCSLAAG